MENTTKYQISNTGILKSTIENGESVYKVENYNRQKPTAYRNKVNKKNYQRYLNFSKNLFVAEGCQMICQVRYP